MKTLLSKEWRTNWATLLVFTCLQLGAFLIPWLGWKMLSPTMALLMVELFAGGSLLSYVGLRGYFGESAAFATTLTLNLVVAIGMTVVIWP